MEEHTSLHTGANANYGATGNQQSESSVTTQSDSQNRVKVICPICQELTSTYCMCVNGHYICESCSERESQCRKCNGSFFSNKNVSASGVKTVYFPCDNSVFGCNETTLWKDKKTHAMNCRFRLYTCPKCTRDAWIGQRRELVDHIKEIHGFDAETADSSWSWLYDPDSQDSFSRVLLVDREMFLYEGAVDPIQRGVLICVKYIGPSDMCDGFEYDLVFYKRSNDINCLNIRYSNMKTAPLDDDIFKLCENGKGISLHECMIKKLLENGKMSLVLSIETLSKKLMAQKK